METGIVGRDRRVIGVRSTETKGLSGVSGRATSIFLYGGLGVSEGWKVKFATWGGVSEHALCWGLDVARMYLFGDIPVAPSWQFISNGYQVSEVTTYHCKPTREKIHRSGQSSPSRSDPDAELQSFPESKSPRHMDLTSQSVTDPARYRRYYYRPH